MIGESSSAVECRSCARAMRMALLSREMLHSPSMISTQHQIEAARRSRKTALATGPACRKRPSGVREMLSMIGPSPEQGNGRDARGQDEPVEAGGGIAGAAGGDVVDQDGADLSALAFDLERLDDGLGAVYRPHLGHQPALDDSLAIEDRQVGRQSLDRGVALVLD